MKDEQLIPIIINQNQEAFSEIVDRYQAKLSRYISHLGHNDSATQDILQKTFIKAFTHLKGFDTSKNFPVGSTELPTMKPLIILTPTKKS